MAITLFIAIIVFLGFNFYGKRKQAKKVNRFIVSAFFAIAVVIVGFSFIQPVKQENTNARFINSEQSPIISERKTNKTIMPVNEWYKLYQELETEIKLDSVFLQSGFSANGQRSHQEWLKRVNSHILPLNAPPIYQATPSNLRQLAIAYVRKDLATISRLKRELDNVFK